MDNSVHFVTDKICSKTAAVQNSREKAARATDKGSGSAQAAP